MIITNELISEFAYKDVVEIAHLVNNSNNNNIPFSMSTNNYFS